MENSKLKIIFVGMPDMAIICLSNLYKKGFNIAGVVPPKKNCNTYKYFEDFVNEKKLNFMPFENSCNDKEYIEKLKALNADIGVVCSYNTLLSEEFLKTAKMGYINCHPSYLPDYRGALPYFHIIKNGEKTSGITLHFMDNNFDTGDIIYQEKFNLVPDETMGTLFNRTNYMLSDALIKTLEKIESGHDLKRIPQPEGCYKEAPKTDGNYIINFSRNVYDLECLIRACNPFYNASTTFRSTYTKIIDARAIEQKHCYPLGSIVPSDSSKILVAASGGFLSLNIIHIGSWGIFSPKEFNCLFSPKAGEKFG